MLKRVLPYFFMALLLTLFGSGVGYIVGKEEKMNSVVIKERPVKTVVQQPVPSKVEPVVVAPPQPKEEKAAEPVVVAPPQPKEEKIAEIPQQVAVVVPAEPKKESREQIFARKAKSRKIERDAVRKAIQRPE